jgi:hypothetical protein
MLVCCAKSDGILGPTPYQDAQQSLAVVDRVKRFGSGPKHLVPRAESRWASLHAACFDQCHTAQTHPQVRRETWTFLVDAVVHDSQRSFSRTIS